MGNGNSACFQTGNRAVFGLSVLPLLNFAKKKNSVESNDPYLDILFSFSLLVLTKFFVE